MKQSVFFKTMLSVMAALPLLTACDSENVVATNNQAKNELRVNVGIATPQRPDNISPESRVVNPTGATIYKWGSAAPENVNPANFGSGESIGIFLRDAATEGPYGFITWDGSGTNAQITGPYDNLRYTSVGNYHSTQVWNYVSAPGRPSVTLPEGVYSQLCAYYPYDGSVTYDGNKYSYSSSPYGSTPYTLIQGSIISSPGNEVSDLLSGNAGWLIDSSTGIDYMYCPATGPVGGTYIDGNLPMVNIKFHHAQTCLKFKISVPSTFSGSANVTKFKVYGGFAMKSRVDIWTGNVTYRDMPSATADTIDVQASASSVLKTINATTPYETAYFCVPLNESVPTNLSIEVTIDGHTYRATISALTLMREWIYEIPLMLTQGQLVVNQVEIIPWTINSSIPVTPLL